MEYIPTEYYDPTDKKTYDLTKADMPKAATFICVGGRASDDRPSEMVALEIWVVPKQERLNEVTKMYEPVPNTAVRIKFKGGHRSIQNRRLLKMLMESKPYRDGDVQINPEDPTGFWREQGAIQEKTVSVYEPTGIKQPTFAEVDLKKVKPVTEETKPNPLAKVI